MSSSGFVIWKDQRKQPAVFGPGGWILRDSFQEACENVVEFDSKGYTTIAVACNGAVFSREADQWNTTLPILAFTPRTLRRGSLSAHTVNSAEMSCWIAAPHLHGVSAQQLEDRLRDFYGFAYFDAKNAYAFFSTVENATECMKACPYMDFGAQSYKLRLVKAEKRVRS